MMLSKSEYMLYVRHPAWLWIKKHAKHLMPPVDEALQARFDEGNAFEPFVESLFPDLKRIGSVSNEQPMWCEEHHPILGLNACSIEAAW